MVGCHIGMVPLRLRGGALTGDCGAMARIAGRAFAGQDVPLPVLLQALGQAEHGRPPLFQVLFALQDNAPPQLRTCRACAPRSCVNRTRTCRWSSSELWPDRRCPAAGRDLVPARLRDLGDGAAGRAPLRRPAACTARKPAMTTTALPPTALIDPAGLTPTRAPMPAATRARIWRWMREHRPVYCHPAGALPAFWSLTRYDDIRAAYRDDELFSSAHGVLLRPTRGGADPGAGMTLALTDPAAAQAAALRFVAAWFSQRSIPGTWSSRSVPPCARRWRRLPKSGGCDGVLDIAAAVQPRHLHAARGARSRSREHLRLDQRGLCGAPAACRAPWPDGLFQRPDVRPDGGTEG